MKKVIFCIAVLLAVISCAKLVGTIMQTEVTVNSEGATGVYNRETGEFDGMITGWSSGGGMGSIAQEVKEAANKAYTGGIVRWGACVGVFAIVALALVPGMRRDKARRLYMEERARRAEQGR